MAELSLDSEVTERTISYNGHTDDFFDSLVSAFGEEYVEDLKKVIALDHVLVDTATDSELDELEYGEFGYLIDRVDLIGAVIHTAHGDQRAVTHEQLQSDFEAPSLDDYWETYHG